MKSNDFNQYDFAISKFDPLDRSLYDKYDSIEFGNRIIKKYGIIDSSTMNFDKVKLEVIKVV